MVFVAKWEKGKREAWTPSEDQHVDEGDKQGCAKMREERGTGSASGRQREREG